MLGWRANPAGQKSLTRVEKTHGKGKALTVLAHQLARAVSSMFKRAVTFDRATLLRQSEAERAPDASLDVYGLRLESTRQQADLPASMNAKGCVVDWP